MLQSTFQCFLYQLEISVVRHRASFRVANMKNVQDRAVASHKRIHAENIQRNNGHGARDFGQKLPSVPGEKSGKSVPLGREWFPLHGRDQWVIVKRRAFEESPKELNVPDNVRNPRSTKIAFGHVLEMRLDFVGEIRREMCRYLRSQACQLDLGLLVVRLLIRQVLAGRMIE